MTHTAIWPLDPFLAVPADHQCGFLFKTLDHHPLLLKNSGTGSAGGLEPSPVGVPHDASRSRYVSIKRDLSPAWRLQGHFWRERHFWVGHQYEAYERAEKSNSACTGMRSLLAIRSRVSNEGALMPRSIRLRNSSRLRRSSLESQSRFHAGYCLLDSRVLDTLVFPAHELPSMT